MTFNINDPYKKSSIHWENYIFGVIEELKKIEPNLKNDVIKVFDLKNSINSKKSYGGTSFENIKKMIKKYKNA